MIQPRTCWRAGVLLALMSVHPWATSRGAWDRYEVAGDPLLQPAITVFSSSAAMPPAGERIRIAYYNIEMFTDGVQDGKNRTVELAMNQAQGAAKIIDQLQADILFIAEIENARALTMLNDALAEPYPAGYIVEFGTGGRRREKMNIAMLARYAPELVHEIDFGPLTGDGRPTRGLFRALFPLEGDRHLLLYSAHLKSNWGSRNRNYAQRYHAMRFLRDDIQQLRADYPERQWEKLILADFNSDPELAQFTNDPTWQVLEDWIDLWAAHPDRASIHSVPTRFGDPRFEFPPALFDRVLAHPEMQRPPWVVSLPALIPEGVQTHDVSLKPGEAGHISDHYPVYIDIQRVSGDR